MRFSLKLKLFVAFISTAIVLLGIATWMMIGYSENDKKTYIFDLNADIAMNFSEEINTYLSSTMENMSILANLIDRNIGKQMDDSADKQESKILNKLTKVIFDQYHDINAFFLYNDESLITQIYKRNLSSESSISIDDYLKKINSEPIPFEDILNGKKYIRNLTVSSAFPVFLIAIPYELHSIHKTSVIVAVVSTEKLLNWIKKSTAFEAYIVDRKGRIVVHKDANSILINKDVSDIEIVKLHLKENASPTTIAFEEKGKGAFLGAYSPVKDTGLGLIVQRPKDDAFVALEQLKGKIFNMVLFVFAIALIASVVFARGLTRPIDELTKGAVEIGKGNFAIDIKVTSKDEIGDLAGTLNDMASRLDVRERELRRTYEKLISSKKMASCYLIGQKISSILDLEKIFSMSAKYARELADTKASLLLVYDENKMELKGKASDGLVEKAVKLFVFQTDGLDPKNQEKLQEDIEKNSLLKSKLYDDFNMKSCIIVPITLFNNLYGVLILMNKLNGDFTDNDYNFLRLFAAQCAIACGNARLYKKTEFMAVRDGLTGLFNRRYFAERSKEEFSAIKREFRPLSYLILDVDFFKKVNDTHGHLIGDNVLKDLAKILSENLREVDIVFRYGGEEFIIMLTTTNKEDAIILAERVREKVEQYRFEYDGVSLPITVSIGVSSFGDIKNFENQDYKDLLKCADLALYKAKDNGRNRVEAYSEKEYKNAA